ncbi:hypothetical protein OHB54_42890 [Streptomyces sp. NBC_01007]|nr:hypothetical protein OHB54_42890 [Streptomyces sp. NBC_01007]
MSGSTTLISLARTPTTMVIYAAGITALAAERRGTLVHVVTEPQAQNPSSDSSPG